MQIKFVSMMSGSLDPFFRELARYLTSRAGLEMSAVDGMPWQERERMLDRGEAHLGFLCGLYYTRRIEAGDAAVELLAAPVARGRRYGGRPVYFSDVVVRKDAVYRSLDDLRGARWSYNEPRSHSGYNVVRYHLARRGLDGSHFRKVVEAGSHLASLERILDGSVDASAIDSTVLDLELRARPELSSRVRVIHTLGPSTIPPCVVRRDLPASTRVAVRSALLALHRSAEGRRVLDMGLIARFRPVRDADYDDIRTMAALADQVVLAPTPEGLSA